MSLGLWYSFLKKYRSKTILILVKVCQETWVVLVLWNYIFLSERIKQQKDELAEKSKK